LATRPAAGLRQDMPQDALALAVAAEKIFQDRWHMADTNNLITVSVNVDITPTSLQAVVENAKQSVGRDEKGIYRVDTAVWLGNVISDFLKLHDFETYAKNLRPK